MQNAGYEETGKSYLRENIKTYGRFFYCITVFGICLVGAVIEVYRNEKREKERNFQGIFATVLDVIARSVISAD